MLGWLKRRELRETVSGGPSGPPADTYAALALRVRQAQVLGLQSESASGLASVSACASVWAAALSACEITGPPAVSKPVMEYIGYDLIRRGQSVWKVGIANGMPTLTRPHGAHRLNAGWSLTWNHAPDNSVIETALDSEIANIRWEPSPLDSWSAIAPWESVTAAFAVALDAHHRDLSAGPGGYLLQVAPDGETSPDRDGEAIRETEEIAGPRLTGKYRGQLNILSLPSDYETKGQSGSVAPGKVSHDPGEGTSSNRKQLTAEICGACGVPVALVDGTGGAAAIREGQRIFANRLQSRADRIASELTDALGLPVEIDASAVFKTDIAMRSRAFKSLVDAGMNEAMAAQLCGLTEVG